ncbi:hypothetical protein BH10PSE12_BH10PSE12_16460 [soil metagenome]
MIAAFALFLAVGAPAAAEAVPPAQDDIVVIARQLAAVSVWLAPDAKGQLSCGMNMSSGDVALDEKLCKAAAQCWKKGATAAPDMKNCIETRKPTLLKELSDNRHQDHL